MTIQSSLREPLPSRQGDQSPRVSDSSSLDGLSGGQVAQLARCKPSRARTGIRITQIFSLAILLNLATDACQFCDNLVNPSLSTRSNPSFFVSAQFGGFGGGGGRRRHFGGGGGGGRGPGKKEEPSEDYYQILGVPRDANEAQIKKSFKKLAIKYHPDKNKDDPEGAKKKF